VGDFPWNFSELNKIKSSENVLRSEMLSPNGVLLPRITVNTLCRIGICLGRAPPPQQILPSAVIHVRVLDF
jgi:hypothetical protein